MGLTWLLGRTILNLASGKRLVVLAILLGSLSHAQGAYYVIVNEKNPEPKISKKYLKQIYLGNKTHWEDGTKISPVRPADDPKLDGNFISDVTGRSSQDFKTHWRRKLFSGRGLPPRRLKADQEMVDFVGRTPGAIGVVSGPVKKEGVKVIEVIETATP